MISYFLLFVEKLHDSLHAILHVMKIHIKKVIRLFLALFFIVIGAFGLVLPILNGTFFIIVALILISLEVPALEAWLDSLSEKNKTAHKIYVKMKRFIKKYF
jgi:uncharacterized membrane protein YbaN (DUF454 family)